MSMIELVEAKKIYHAGDQEVRALAS